MKEDEIDTAISNLNAERSWMPVLLMLGWVFFAGAAAGFWSGAVAVSEANHAKLEELRTDLRKIQDVATDLDERLRERNKHIRVLLDARDEEAQRRQLREMFAEPIQAKPRRIEFLPAIPAEFLLVMPLVDENR